MTVAAGLRAVVQRQTHVSWEGGTVACLVEMLHVKEILPAARTTVPCSTIVQHLTPAVQVLQLLIISTGQRQHRQHGDENIRE